MNYIFLILILLGGNCEKLFAQQDTSYALAINIRIEKEYDLKFSKKDFSYEISRGHYNITTDSVKQTQYDIKIEIKNNSNKAAFIWLMTCSWEDNFQFNNNYIYFYRDGCDSNFPELRKIDSGESKIYEISIRKSIKFEYPCEYCIYGPQVETTKLGLIIIDDLFEPKLDAFLGYKLAMEDKSLWRIIWSNPLYLLTKNELSPKPVGIPLLLRQ